ncbi:helix-turn-helix domain-containing protein [Amycolatopsis sp. CB00013]|uniref:helix-turn-helix domain-containing protein n=1 Tax=Amycolatopsis sp. CB00013 TaxID=1703945 RepID=UPI00116145E1|nr:helix-turn-helix transcriptional regulator [Amycolatopsis sp. CB00013]
MPRGRNPVAAQRKLRSELRRRRSVSKLTQKEVADALSWSMSKVIRMETGVVGVSITDLWALLNLYGVTDPVTVKEIEDLARMARERAWWDDYHEYASAELIEFIATEASAVKMAQYQSFIVPGILQTPEYIRSLGVAFDWSDEDIEQGIKMRTSRQELLTDPDGPKASFILDEASISRSIGSPHVMREQFDHLKHLNRLPNVDIQVAAFANGVTHGMQVPFTIFTFDDDREAPLVYLDQSSGPTLARGNAVSRHLRIFDNLLQPEHSSRPEQLDEELDRVGGNIGI